VLKQPALEVEPSPPALELLTLVLTDPVDEECRLVGVWGADGGWGDVDEAFPALPLEPEPETTLGRL